jgi:hypothetical protein
MATTTDAPPTDAPTPTETTATTVAPTGDDLARLALLTIDSFPEGWTEQPQDSAEDEEDAEIDARVDECVGLGPDPVSRTLDDRDVEGPRFDSPDGALTVEQSVVVVDDGAMADQVMAEVGNERVPGCLQQVFTEFFAEVMADPEQTDFPPGTELDEVIVTPTDTGGLDAVAQQASITLSSGDDSLTLFIDTWYQRNGNVLSRIEFQSVGQPFPAEGVAALTEAVDILIRAAAAAG